MLVEKSIQIIGSKKLNGTIEVSGAKKRCAETNDIANLIRGKIQN